MSTTVATSFRGGEPHRRSVECVFETAHPETPATARKRRHAAHSVPGTTSTEADDARTVEDDPATSVDPAGGDEDEKETRPRVRLAQLAAAAETAAGRRSSSSSRRHSAATTFGGSGGLIERWLPGGRRATAPRRRLTIVAVLGGVLVIAVAVAVVIGNRPEPERAPPLPTVRQVSASPEQAGGSGTAPSGAAPTTADEPTSLVVSVVGTVAEPGLITVRPGARVADVIEMAGGAGSDDDLLTVNLARRVSDGEQIYVGVTPPPGAERPPAGAEPASPSTSDAKVDLNTADRQLLETLPGVGEATAARILEWRERHGRFTAVNQLREIDGIGDKRFARLRDRVSVG